MRVPQPIALRGLPVSRRSMFCRNNVLLRSVCSVSSTASQYWRHSAVSQALLSTSAKFKKQEPNNQHSGELRNASITFPSMRVVYTGDDGKNAWKIMDRLDALALATQKKMDLIVVSATSDPPVCKLESRVNLNLAAKQAAKQQRALEKKRTVKEMFMTGGIERRDFLMKMKKVVEFLKKGHPVKVSIVPKKFLKNHRLDKDGKRKDRMKGFDETIIMLLEELETIEVTVTEQKVKKPTPAAAQTATGKKGIPAKKVDVKAAKSKLSQTGSDSSDSEDDSDNSDDSSEESESDEPSEEEEDSEEEDEEVEEAYDTSVDVIKVRKTVDDDGETTILDDPLNGKSAVYFGQKALIKREFLVTPKASMIAPAKVPKKDKYSKQ